MGLQKSPPIFIVFIHYAIHKATTGHEYKKAASILTLFSGISHLMSLLLNKLAMCFPF